MNDMVCGNFNFRSFYSFVHWDFGHEICFAVEMNAVANDKKKYDRVTEKHYYL